jgi:hypothetical protein
MMLPMPVGEGARPYFPYAFPVFNGEGMALGMEMFKSEEIESALPQAFMNLVETVQALPQTLQVGSEQVCTLLDPIARKLKIPIQRVESLPALEYFLQGMGEFLGA